jgi:hypothetical protein
MTNKKIFWFEKGRTERNRIAPAYDDVHIKSWSLSAQTFNMLMRHNVNMSVGDILRADKTFVEIPNLGPQSYTELDEKVAKLLRGFEDDVDDKARDAIASEKIPTSNVITSPTHLPGPIQAMLLNQLHFPVRTHNALTRQGITTIGELFNLTHGDLHKVSGLGQKAVLDVRQCLVDLTNSIEDDEVNWVRFCQAQNIQLIPFSYTVTTTTTEIISGLPQIIKEILLNEFDERTWIIIQRRFGVKGAEKLSLEELGEAFGLTRERIRQIEKKALYILRETMIDGTYATKRYRLYPEVQFTLQDLCSILPLTENQLITETEIFDRVSERFNINPQQMISTLFLIFSLTDADKVEFHYSHISPIWGKADKKTLAKIETGISRIDAYLTRETSLPQKEFDILLWVNRGLKKNRKLTLVKLRQCLSLCSSIEKREDGLFWGKFRYLKGRGNQVERILIEAGKPMSVPDITRIINHRLVPLGERKADARTVGHQISNDARIVPIGRSGEWGLQTWKHIDTSTIIDLMEQCLITLNRPATIDEIYEYISERRSVSKQSIVVYLGNENTFAKIDRERWGLARWAEARHAQTWNLEDVAELVSNLFKKQKTKKLEYQVVKSELMEAADVTSRQAQGMLNVNGVIKTRRVKGKLYAIFQVDYKKKRPDSGARFTSKKKTLREQVDNSVKNILEGTPTKQITIAELIEKLQDEFPHRPKATLYQYASKLDYLEKIKILGSRTQLYRLKGGKDKLSLPQIEEIADEPLRKKIKRATLFLTEEDIDVGLFLLSKEFEAALKTYLVEGNKRKKVKMLPRGKSPDKWRLAGMVDCAKNNGIITDNAVLHFLRQERNNRAHGSMPSLEERRILMSSVQYIAGMYIDYIKLLNDLASSL